MNQTQIAEALNGAQFPFTNELINAVISKINMISNYQEIEQMISGGLLKFNLYDRGNKITKFLPKEEIFYIKADADYKRIVIKDQEFMIKSNFARLKISGMFRCHKKYLINLKNVDSYHKVRYKDFVTMKNGGIIPVGRTYLKQLKKELM